MKRMGFCVARLAAVGLVFTFNALAIDQFWEMGPTPWPGTTTAKQISRDGSTVIGKFSDNAGMTRPVFWRVGLPWAIFLDPANGMQLPPGESAAVSVDGTRFLTYGFDNTQSNTAFKRAFVSDSPDNQTWSFPFPSHSVGLTGSSYFFYHAFLSADAQFALGTRQGAGPNGMPEVHLISLAPGSSTDINMGAIASGATFEILAASDDLQVFGGLYYTGTFGNNKKGFVHFNNQFIPIAQLHPLLNKTGEVSSVSPDGQILVGSVKIANIGFRPFIFNRTTGQLTFIMTTYRPGLDIYARALSANGQVIVGSIEAQPGNTGFGPPQAFRWVCDPGNGGFIRESIQQELIARTSGTAIGEWELHDALSVSGDGRTLVGDGKSPTNGSNAGTIQPWMATLELPQVSSGVGCY